MILQILKMLNTLKISRQLMYSTALSGKACLLNLRKNYKSYENINDAEFKVFSQNGEDGIIDFLLYMTSSKNSKFIEIGTENYDEANTRFLYETSNSKGLIIDDSFNLKKLSNELDFWKRKIVAVKTKITSQNINLVLKKNDFYNDIDLFSIDIDGIDYWVIKELPKKFAKIFVVEFNPVFGPNLEISVPNIKNFNRTKYHYSNLCWGVSLRALVKLMKAKGYIFLGVNQLKNNAFFVIDDFENEFTKIINKIDQNDLSIFTENEFMESRDKKGNLSFIEKKKQIHEIKDCEVIDLKTSEKKIIKIKELV
jgi:hypothetical protein